MLVLSFALAGPATAVGPRKSATFAGYQANVTGAITVKTSFTVPSVACTAGFQASNLAVGSGSGKSRETIGLLIECNGAGPAAYGVWVLYNKFSSGPGSAIWTNCCSAGDAISLTTTYDPVAGSGSVTFLDQTTSTSHGFPNLPLGKSTKAVPAFVGVTNDNPTFARAAVPNFGSVTFSSSTINGGSLAPAKAYEQVSASKIVQITVSQLDHTGEGFSDTFAHA